MAITVNKPLVIAQTQTFKFQSVNLIKSPSGKLQAIATFIILDSSNKVVDSIKLTYTGDDYNYFWNHFNSGKFLYDELNSKQNLQVIVPTNIEAEFTNPVPPPPNPPAPTPSDSGSGSNSSSNNQGNT